MKKYKVRIYIRLRESVSDAAGNAVKANCNKVAPDIKVEKLRINKIIEMLIGAESEEKAREQLDLLSDRLFANIVIEDWEYDLLEVTEHFPDSSF
jgi:phosphoribosylformylglycinamidine synthase|tara:strand:- start:101 stop:385 length:285 start_codon:yes stop_codon:yes gene_type:complete